VKGQDLSHIGDYSMLAPDVVFDAEDLVTRALWSAVDDQHSADRRKALEIPMPVGR
jgi:hypothetical protein